MKTLRQGPSLVCTLCMTTFLTGSPVVVPAASEQRPGAAPVGRDLPSATASRFADVQFRAPKRFAVISQARESVRNLYTNGDHLVQPQDPTQSMSIQEVTTQGIVIRERHSGLERSLGLGEAIPGFPGLILVGTAMLDRLHYRFRVVDRIVQPEPVLVSLVGSEAVLEKEVLRLPSDPLLAAPKLPPSQRTEKKVDPALFESVRVQEIDANTYGLSASALQAVIENIGEVFSGLGPMAIPAFSSQTGMTLNITSGVGDGTLSRSGFTVTSSRVAQIFGIEVGDTIITLNSHPVNSPLNAWWTFQEIFVKNPSLTDLRVDLIRGGSLMTKTFRIR